MEWVPSGDEAERRRRRWPIDLIRDRNRIDFPAVGAAHRIQPTGCTDGGEPHYSRCPNARVERRTIHDAEHAVRRGRLQAELTAFIDHPPRTDTHVRFGSDRTTRDGAEKIRCG